MTIIKKTLPLLLSASALLSSSLLMADSQYGYSSSGATGITAQSSVKVTVNVPSLILLRVGAANTTQSELTFTATPNIPAANTPSANNNVNVDWNGAAPSFGSTTGSTVRAYAWTNLPGKGKINCSVTTPFPTASNLLASHVLVTNANVTDDANVQAPLSHPGSDTTCGGTSEFNRNTLAASDWTFSISAAGMAIAAPGTASQVVTYTATAL